MAWQKAQPAHTTHQAAPRAAAAFAIQQLLKSSLQHAQILSSFVANDHFLKNQTKICIELELEDDDRLQQD